MTPKTKLVLILVLATFGLGCSRTSGNSDAKLDEILKRLEAIDAKLSAGGGGGNNGGPPMPKPGVAYAIPVHPDDAFRGGAHAKVTIVEAFEFACPYCAMIAPTLTDLTKEYKPDDLKVVSKHLLIHPDIAATASLATCAAHRQNKFAEFEHALWSQAWGDNLQQPNFNRESLSPESLRKLAEKTGLDLAKYDSDVKEACTEVVGRNIQEWGAVGVMATPTIFINGVAYNGDRSVGGFKKVIDEEIKKADKAISEGTKLEDYYASIMKAAKPKIE